GTYSEIYSEGQMSWGDGLELERISFKHNGSSLVELSRESSVYSRDPSIDDVVEGFKVSRKFFQPCRSFATSDTDEQAYLTALDEIDATRYYITANWYYLSLKKNIVYDLNGQNPVTTITEYYYDNEVHQQLSGTKTTNSDGKILLTKNYYPDDITGTTFLVGDALSTNEWNTIGRLKSIGTNSLHKSASLIQTETYNDINANGVAESNELLSIQRTNYKDWTNNIVLPIDVQNLKGIYSNPSNILQDRITYVDYDTTNGNPLEISKADGTHIVYIWGYSKQYPIAIIENATYSQVSSQVSNLQSLSNSDSERCMDSVTYNCSEKNLRNALTSLRN